MKIENKLKGKIQAWQISKTYKISEIFVKDHFSYKKNLTPNQYLTDLASISKGLTVDMEIKYVALSTAYDPPNKQTVLELEIARVVPLSISQVNNKLIIEGKFDNTFFTKQTNITAVTDKKIFTVTSSTGLSVGDRIQVKINSNWEQRKIVNIAGNIITVHENFTSLPTAGTDNVQQMISRLHLIYGSGATLAINTGKACSLAQLVTYKPSTADIYTRHEIEFLGS